MMLNKIRYYYTHKIIQDSGQILIINTIEAVIALLSAAVLTRLLSVADYGIFKLLAAYLGIGMLVGLPGMNIIVRKVGLLNNDGIVLKAIRLSFYTSVFSSIILLIISLVVFWFSPGLNLLVVIIACLFLPLLGLEKYDPILQGKRRIVLSSMLELVLALATLIVLGALAYFTRNVFVVIAGLFIVKFLFNFISLFWALKFLDMRYVVEDEKSLLADGWQLSALTILNLLVSYLDRIIIGNISPAQLAFYSIGSLIPGRVKDQFKALSVVPITAWSTLDKEHYIKKLHQNMLKIAIGLFFFSLLLALSAYIYIPFLFGAKFKPAILVAQIVSFSVFFRMLTYFMANIDLTYMRSFFYQKTIYYRSGFYLLIMPMLLWGYGINGLAWAILLSDVSWFVMYYWFFRKQLKNV